MSRCTLYVDTDGTYPGTKVCVIGEDGGLVGELEGVHDLTYQINPVHRKARVVLTLLRVPGRFLANDILIEEIGPKRRRWWRR